MFTIETNGNSFYDQNHGYVTINVKVDGFWSSPMTLYVNRAFSGNWVYSISNSSGGRDTDVCDELTAYRNYGNAMVALVEFAKTLDHDKLEAGYQNYIETVCKPEEEARKRRAAKIKEEQDADPAITIEEVRALMQRIKGTSTSIVFKPRVHSHHAAITVRHLYGAYAIETSHAFKRYSNLSFVKNIAALYSKNYEMTTV